MKITSITRQVTLKDRYSILIDGEYSFSLSELALLKSKIVKGQEIDELKLKELKKLSDNDKIYNQTLRLVASRPKTEWEVKHYLELKGASPTLVESILNKLRDINLVDDNKYAESFVNNKRLLHPASRRKITLDLKKKHISQEAIDNALGGDQESEQSALISIIERKRRQSKYQDNLKLMQYLSRQGFNYSDIKAALSRIDEETS